MRGIQTFLFQSLNDTAAIVICSNSSHKSCVHTQAIQMYTHIDSISSGIRCSDIVVYIHIAVTNCGNSQCTHRFSTPFSSHSAFLCYIILKGISVRNRLIHGNPTEYPRICLVNLQALVLLFFRFQPMHHPVSAKVAVISTAVH